MSTQPIGSDPEIRHVERTNTYDSTTGDPFVLALEEQDREDEVAVANGAAPLKVQTEQKSKIQQQPRDGAILTGKQEHYLKRELISQQTKFEISELSSPTALQRFGAPFRSDAGEVPPEDSELPLLRYIFVHHVRDFPFLDQAREKEFWQDKLQVFLESFATKRISSSEDRLEETKRRKLAMKAEKLVELMMVSGIPTASGYEERIRFEEMEVVDRGANESGLIANTPEGHWINGWDVNVAGVRMTSVKRTVRYHQHAEFLIRVKERGKDERYVGRRYGQFVRLHRALKLEFPGKVLPPVPRKNLKHTGTFIGANGDGDDDSISSMSTTDERAGDGGSEYLGGGLRSYLGFGHKRNASTASVNSRSSSQSRRSVDQSRGEHVTLHREDQRVSLRAFLRSFLQNERIARSNAMREFLTADPVKLNREELEDIAKRKSLDEKRIEEQKQFYEIARKRAAELDVHMERFRREVIERNGLTSLFKEIRVKERIADLTPEYKKFAEWLRIEVAATLYHLFLAEDNSPELFAQAKRIHSLVPYVALKNVIRYANPAAVMKGVLDLFLAQPLGARSLMQRIFGLAINDGIRSGQKNIDILCTKIKDPAFSDKIKNYVEAPEDLKNTLRTESADTGDDLIVVILRNETLEPELDDHQIGTVFNAFVAWTSAVDANTESYTDFMAGAELYSHLKQLLKLQTRQRDKSSMLALIEEPVTLSLFRDLFTIFYEPLVRVYKSANVYNSVTDFASFADDTMKVIEACQRQDISAADPNQTVQAFIDLCARHEDDLYKFIHEVHIHDNGLFDQLMGWLEGILEFLRHGPRGGKLDMNALFQGAVSSGVVDKEKAIGELNALIDWQTARKNWHRDKTRRKMGAGDDGDGDGMGDLTPLQSRTNSAGTGNGNGLSPLSPLSPTSPRSATTPSSAKLFSSRIKSSDFGINSLDIQELGFSTEDMDEEAETAERDAEDDEAENEGDAIAVERRRRKRVQEALRSRRGEPVKPAVDELRKLWLDERGGFGVLLRGVLAE